MIDNRKNARLTDFGNSKDVHADNKIISSTQRSYDWTPPEYIQDEEAYHNPEPSADVWSVGCTYVEVDYFRDSCQILICSRLAPSRDGSLLSSYVAARANSSWKTASAEQIRR